MVRRSTWILLGVLAAVAVGYAAWQRYAPEPETPAATDVPESPWAMLPEEVESVRLVDPSRPTVVMLRRDPQEGWRMLAPSIGPAESGRIEAALAGVLAPPVRQVIAEAADLEAYGLDPAALRLTLLLVDGTARSMDVGSIDPTGTVYYAQVPGDTRVLLVNRYALEDLLGMLEAPPVPQTTGTAAAGTEEAPTP